MIKRLKNTVARLYESIARQLRQLDAADFRVMLLAFAIAMLSLGANALRPGLGYVTAGAVILFYIRPLMKWIK